MSKMRVRTNPNANTIPQMVKVSIRTKLGPNFTRDLELIMADIFISTTIERQKRHSSSPTSLRSTWFLQLSAKGLRSKINYPRFSKNKFCPTNEVHEKSLMLILEGKIFRYKETSRGGVCHGKLKYDKMRRDSSNRLRLSTLGNIAQKQQ